jgi:histidinol dehydrogenase
MTIVADVKEHGFGAVRDWALELDGIEPARAAPAGPIPEQAIHELADRVRRWHAL